MSNVYYNQYTKQAYTGTTLQNAGLTMDEETLRKAGIYPLQDMIIPYDPLTQRLEKWGTPQLSPKGNCFYQHYITSELSEDEKQVKRIEVAKESLAAVDASTVRPLRAWLAGNATETDLKKLFDLECEAQRLRAVIAGTDLPPARTYTAGCIPDKPLLPSTPEVVLTDETVCE